MQLRNQQSHSPSPMPVITPKLQNHLIKKPKRIKKITVEEVKQEEKVEPNDQPLLTVPYMSRTAMRR